MKKILITGAGSGLGAELAKVYAEDGNHIILVGRNIDKLNRISEEIVKKGGSSESMVCDITNADSVKELVNNVVGIHGKIDCLINNAGVGYFGPIDEVTLDEIDAMLNTNVKGTILVTQGLLPYVNDRILNIISTAGLRGKVNEAVYCASKFAVRGFTESLQREFEGRKPDITAVYMGGMNTPFWENSDHIKDKSRLKSSAEVALMIKKIDDGRKEIIIDK